MNHPYEIHLTVMNVTRDEFVNACGVVGVKPVMLELQSRSNGILSDVMTSSSIMGSYHDALVHMTETSMKLRLEFGFAISRYKVETAPWNPLIEDNDKRTASQYFECHLALHLPVDMTSLHIRSIMNLCATRDLHLSRNTFKETGDYVVHMATLRDYTAVRADFELQVEQTIAYLTSNGVVVGKREIEFALLDTNPTHDGRWME